MTILRYRYTLYRNKINLLLLGILSILVAVYYLRKYPGYVPTDIDRLSKTASLLRDFLNIFGIIIAGLWSYYIFIKGRTFAPRARLSINVKEVSPTHQMAIVRFKIENIGKTKLSPLKGRAQYFLGHVDKDQIVFCPFYGDSNLLQSYHEADESLILEPGDEINVDTPIFIGNTPNALLMVKCIFEVSEHRSYKENSVFCLNTSEAIYESNKYSTTVTTKP